MNEKYFRLTKIFQTSEPSNVSSYCFGMIQDGASEADLSILPKYRFRITSNEDKPSGGAGLMVPIETSSAYLANERMLLPEDAVCSSQNAIYFSLMFITSTKQTLAPGVDA